MKALVLVNTALAGMLMGGAAWAANDCADPVADWQPRERLRQQIEQRGGTVQRIKVDDGCYEVRGIDARGNRFKGKYSPQSLRIKKLEIEFSDDAEAADYLDQHRKPNDAPAERGPVCRMAPVGI